MIEDEAKTKMCCGPQGVAMTMIVVHGDPGKVEMTPDAGCCIGSGCMAWRWTERPATKTEWRPRYDSTSMAEVVTRLPGAGYCGLAGPDQ